MPTFPMLPQIRFILIETSHPGNIGGVARAMKCMELSNLFLVAPKHFPHPDAQRRAAGAEDLLDRARVFPDTKKAVSDCVFIVGTTARERSIEWPVEYPRQAARKVVKQARKGPVAVLFGRERNGLTNEEVELCHLLVRIPTGPGYTSLNLASAAQILAYELYLEMQPLACRPVAPLQAADQYSMDGFYRHLETTLHDLDFVKANQPVKLMRKLARLFNRAQPTLEEVNILRGILTAAQTAARSDIG